MKYVKEEYTVCDVCQKRIYGDFTTIDFTWDKTQKDSFDACYYCLRDRYRGTRNLLRKIVDMIKAK
jgi:hypothetical protein